MTVGGLVRLKVSVLTVSVFCCAAISSAHAGSFAYQLSGTFTKLTGTLDLTPELAGVDVGTQWVMDLNFDDSDELINGIYRLSPEQMQLRFDSGDPVLVNSPSIIFTNDRFPGYDTVVISALVGNVLAGTYTSVSVSLIDRTGTAFDENTAVNGLTLSDFTDAENEDLVELSNNSLSFRLNGIVETLRPTGGTTIPGDTDGDGDIDDTDLGIAISNFTGPVGAAGNKTFGQGDTDGDGDIDDTDLGVAISGFTGPLTPTSVPEPASLVLLFTAGLFTARPRRQV